MENDQVKKIVQMQDEQIPDDEQQKLNKPLEVQEGFDADDEAFLQMIVSKVEAKEIDLYKPSSLLNNAVYGKLNEKAQGKADFDSVNLLSAIREIYNLWKMGEKNSYQIQNQVHRIRMTKERLEEEAGDIYII
ncbi:hypothetical protein GF340_03280 [Candidatus Peregrinibacteria bacterium]|nr:hypothetical protein [Candidatus Peregrinibacteria bacterium]